MHWGFWGLFSRFTTVFGDFSGDYLGRSSLPVYEINKTKIQTPYAKVRPFQKKFQLHFSAWRLAHAVKIADCARLPPSYITNIRSFGFILENAFMFDWSKGELFLNDSMSRHYADISSTSLAGRIGQGMSLLLLDHEDYKYKARFDTFWEDYCCTNNYNQKPKKKSPDFIFEHKNNRDWILAEAKGRFVKPSSIANVKKSLSDGLEQLHGWNTLINPQPKNGFSIGTFLRETNDRSSEKSYIAFVDPESEKPVKPREFRRDAVRRENYASWLSVMGYYDLANRLRGRPGERRRYNFPIVKINGNNFAIRIAASYPIIDEFMKYDVFEFIHNPFYYDFIQKNSKFCIEILGIELSILNQLFHVLLENNESALFEIKDCESFDSITEISGGNFVGSIISDGSLLGAIICDKIQDSRYLFDYSQFEL